MRKSIKKFLTKTAKVTVLSIILSLLTALILRISVLVSPSSEKNQTVLSYTDTFTRVDEEIPQQSKAITNEKELKEFFNSDQAHAHLEADIQFHRDSIGYNLAEGKILDGRGYSVTLYDEYATAEVVEIIKGEYYIGISDYIADEERYGIFVNVNDGEISNIKFIFSSSVVMYNNGNAREIALGVVCGENNGIIRNCDLNLSGRFEYYFLSEDFYNSEVFKTIYGGFAGINNGVVRNVGAKYKDFYLGLFTIASADADSGLLFIPAQTLAGGIIGEMGAEATCANVKISGRDVTFALVGIDIVKSEESATYSGAVVAIGCVDNIIVDFDVEYEYKLTGADVVSKNAVTHIGNAINVTALNAYGGGDDLRSDNMSGQSEYCNYIDTGDNARVQVNINYNDDQIIEVSPKLGSGELSFIKYKEQDGEIAEDSGEYANVPQNFSQVIDGDIGIRVAAYQTSGSHYWELIVSEQVIPEPSVPTLEVIALENGVEYVSGTTAVGDVVFTAQAQYGVVEYKINSGDWTTYESPITITQSSQIEFKAISEDGALESEIVKFSVIIQIKQDSAEPVTVLSDWFKVTSSKVYDGSDTVTGEVSLDTDYEDTFHVFMKVKDFLRFSARYAQVNVGTVDIIIEVWLEGTDEYILNNSVVVVQGAITAKEVQVMLDKSCATYGLTDWELNYSVSGLIGNDEIRLEFATNADRHSLPDGDYRFWLAEKTCGNYAVANFDELNSYEYGATLEITKHVVSADEIIFDAQLTDDNVLEISFADVADANVVQRLDVSYELIVDGVATPKQLIDEVGLYRITVFIPQNLLDRYMLSQEIKLFEVQIDKIFTEDVPDDIQGEDPSDDEDEEEDDDIATISPDPEVDGIINSPKPAEDEMSVKAKSVIKTVAIVVAVAVIAIGFGLYYKKRKSTPTKSKLK